MGASPLDVHPGALLDATDDGEVELLDELLRRADEVLEVLAPLEGEVEWVSVELGGDVLDARVHGDALGLDDELDLGASGDDLGVGEEAVADVGDGGPGVTPGELDPEVNGRLGSGEGAVEFSGGLDVVEDGLDVGVGAAEWAGHGDDVAGLGPVNAEGVPGELSEGDAGEGELLAVDDVAADEGEVVVAEGLGDAVDDGVFLELAVAGDGEGEVPRSGAHGADVADDGGDELPAEVLGVELAGDVSGAGHGVDVEDESVGQDGGVVLAGADGEVVGGAAFEDGA